MKKRQQYHADEDRLHKLYLSSIDQVHLSHHSGHPNAHKSHYLEDHHYGTSIGTFEFPMPIEEKDSQIGHISRPKDDADAIGGKIRKSQLNEDQRIRH